MVTVLQRRITAVAMSFLGSHLQFAADAAEERKAKGI